MMMIMMMVLMMSSVSGVSPVSGVSSASSSVKKGPETAPEAKAEAAEPVAGGAMRSSETGDVALIRTPFPA